MLFTLETGCCYVKEHILNPVKNRMQIKNLRYSTPCKNLRKSNGKKEDSKQKTLTQDASNFRKQGCQG